MKKETKEWLSLIWKFTKAVLRLFFTVGSIALGYLSVGMAKLAEFFASLNNRLI